MDLNRLIDVPRDIVAAAYKVDEWCRRNNMHDLVIGPVMSRKPHEDRVAELQHAASIAAEYLEAERVLRGGPPRPDSGFAVQRGWRVTDPEVIRWRKAVAALNTLAAKVEAG